MARKLTADQQKKLDHMKEWCLTIQEFIIGKTGETASVAEKEVNSMARDILIDTYRKKSLRGMRCIFNDSNEWARGGTRAEIDELNQLLREKFGEDLTNQSDRDRKRIRQILKRGRIHTENECRLVESHIDEIYADPANDEELQALNKLLLAFEPKHPDR